MKEGIGRINGGRTIHGRSIHGRRPDLQPLYKVCVLPGGEKKLTPNKMMS